MPVEDRTNEPWPTVNLNADVERLKQTLTKAAQAENQQVTPPPPVTSLGRALGADEIVRMQQFQNLLGPPQTIPPPSGTRLMPEIPQAPPANIRPSEPSGYGGPMPEISAQQFGPRPQFGGGISLPTSIGDINARGSYTTPQEWRATFGLRREF